MSREGSALSSTASPATATGRPDPGAPPPLRADARRNRERVLAAARAAFAESGLDAQVDEIARDAGVGVGTVYRHFATKEALLEAVAVEPLAELIGRARGALDDAEPGAAFERFFRDAAELQVRDRCMGETALGSLAVSSAVMEARAELGRVAGELLHRAQAAGALRADALMEDLPMLVFGIGAGAELADCVPRTTWQRHVQIVLDGLRAPAGALLPPPV